MTRTLEWIDPDSIGGGVYRCRSFWSEVTHEDHG